MSTQFVSKLWQNLCTTGDHLPSKKLSGNLSHLKPEDIELMEFLQQEKPSLLYKSVKDVLENYSTLDGGTSLTAIGNVIRNKLPEGPYSRKQLTKAFAEKFTL